MRIPDYFRDSVLEMNLQDKRGIQVFICGDDRIRSQQERISELVFGDSFPQAPYGGLSYNLLWDVIDGTKGGKRHIGSQLEVALGFGKYNIVELFHIGITDCKRRKQSESLLLETKDQKSLALDVNSLQAGLMWELLEKEYSEIRYFPFVLNHVQGDIVADERALFRLDPLNSNAYSREMIELEDLSLSVPKQMSKAIV